MLKIHVISFITSIHSLNINIINTKDYYQKLNTKY
jgi:hypothetical protein